jgi:NAD(P)-dependent dehydrogenase (short-subunit alcohol dehydrogenase family)
MTGNAGYSLYAASKFALEGASESLAAELAPFNIRVLVIEPGGFRTNFQAAVQSPETPVSEAYKGTPADEIAKRMPAMHGKQPGDPRKAGRLIVEAVTGTGLAGETKGMGVLRLPLGKDAVQRAYTKIDGFRENVEKVKHVSESAVFDELLEK